MAIKLSDYILIGNSRSAALLSKYGSIDWCCLPEFDSPAIFAALLDRERGGYFSINPVFKYRSTQRYIPDTNVVETLFETGSGQARAVDAFTAMAEEDKLYSLFPDHEIIRVVEGISGSVPIKVEFVPRTFYGKSIPHLNYRKNLGVQFVWKENIYTLLSTLEPEQLMVSKDKDKAIAEF